MDGDVQPQTRRRGRAIRSLRDGFFLTPRSRNQTGACAHAPSGATPGKHEESPDARIPGQTVFSAFPLTPCDVWATVPA